MKVRTSESSWSSRRLSCLSTERGHDSVYLVRKRANVRGPLSCPVNVFPAISRRTSSASCA